MAQVRSWDLVAVTESHEVTGKAGYGVEYGTGNQAVIETFGREIFHQVMTVDHFLLVRTRDVDHTVDHAHGHGVPPGLYSDL